MNIHEARAFLADNQPLPQHPNESQLDRFKQVITFLIAQPDEACIPLLLGVFGDWEDLTLYDSVQSILRQFPAEVILPHLVNALNNEDETVATWCADTARYFPHVVLLPTLERLLASNNTYTRLVAAAAIERIGGSQATALAAAALFSEKDEDVREILEAILHLEPSS